MNFRALYFATLLAALGIKVIFHIPSMIIRKLGAAPQKVPFDYYLKYRFRVLHADLFDIFSTPSTRYYDSEDIEAWFHSSDLIVKETKHAVSGWTVYGEK